jgi:hypothetical protein
LRPVRNTLAAADGNVSRACGQTKQTLDARNPAGVETSAEVFMRSFDFVSLALVLLAACGDQSQPGAASASPPASTSSRTAAISSASATAAESGTGTATAAASASATASTSASAAPFVKVTPTDKAPFESVEFRMLAEKDASGWPSFDAVNLGKKPITFLLIVGYAYDQTGKQVGRTKSLNWKDDLAPGDKASLPVRVGQFEDKLPDTAISFELCYRVVEFKGEAKGVRDPNRCPDEKPKGQ